jgi:hypothetical protein
MESYLFLNMNPQHCRPPSVNVDYSSRWFCNDSNAALVTLFLKCISCGQSFDFVCRLQIRVEYVELAGRCCPFRSLPVAAAGACSKEQRSE